MLIKLLFFFNDTATTEIYTLSLHDALPIYGRRMSKSLGTGIDPLDLVSEHGADATRYGLLKMSSTQDRSEEHTSELQSRQYLVCRLLLEKINHLYQLYH